MSVLHNLNFFLVSEPARFAPGLLGGPLFSSGAFPALGGSVVKSHITGVPLGCALYKSWAVDD
jgi:hypothetical protein